MHDALRSWSRTQSHSFCLSKHCECDRQSGVEPRRSPVQLARTAFKVHDGHKFSGQLLLPVFQVKWKLFFLISIFIICACFLNIKLIIVELKQKILRLCKSVRQRTTITPYWTKPWSRGNHSQSTGSNLCSVWRGSVKNITTISETKITQQLK